MSLGACSGLEFVAAPVSAAQVAVSSDDIDYKWSIVPQLAPPTSSSAPSPGTAVSAAAGAASEDPGRHYGILLGKMAGLPPSITDAALQIAQQLDAKQAQRQQRLQEAGNSSSNVAGGGGSMQQLRQVYTLVHKLGCVAREAATQGLLAVDAAGQPVVQQQGGGGAAAGGAGGGLGTSAAGAGEAGGDEDGDGSIVGGGGGELSARCMQMVRVLKQEAEALLLAAARQPG